MAKPRENGSIVYSFATSYERGAKTLYVNVIPKYECPNSCRFCSRADAIMGRPNIYEKKTGTNLYLKEAPQVEEITREINARIKKPVLGLFGGTKEIAFVGLGEPLMQFGLVCDTIHAIRSSGYRGRIRVDTNGLIECIWPGVMFGCFEHVETNPARELKEAGLTDIWISVNATNVYEYEKLCRPRFKNSFEKLCEFVKDCKREGIKTFASFVVGFNDDEVKTRSPQEYIEFAKSLGIKRKNVVIRGYIPPIANWQNS